MSDIIASENRIKNEWERKWREVLMVYSDICPIEVKKMRNPQSEYTVSWSKFEPATSRI
jgi:hypothetical protein